MLKTFSAEGVSIETEGRRIAGRDPDIFAVLRVPDYDISLPLRDLFDRIQKKPEGFERTVDQFRFLVSRHEPTSGIVVTVLDENSQAVREPFICGRVIKQWTASNDAIAFRKTGQYSAIPVSEWREPSKESVIAQNLYNLLIELDEEAYMMRMPNVKPVPLAVPDMLFKPGATRPLQLFHIDCVWTEGRRRGECCIRLDPLALRNMDRIELLIECANIERDMTGNVRGLLLKDSASHMHIADRMAAQNQA